VPSRRKPALRLLPVMYEWQSWADDHEPSDEQLERMSDEEYEAYSDYFILRAKALHPTARKPNFFDQDA
jgi:hypothetical protein